MKEFISLVIFAAIAIAIVWFVTANDLVMQSFFAPKYENVRRNTFEQSKAYNDGMIQELTSMQFQYEQASPEHKQALASLILRRAASYPNALPPDLFAFIQSLKTQTPAQHSNY